MKSFKLNAEPRTELGKKASKALRKESKIPVVLNGGEIVELPYTGELGSGQKVVELCNNKGIITTDLMVNTEDVKKTHLHSRHFCYRTYFQRQDHKCRSQGFANTPRNR